jgi:peptide/nickel transport system ATP-binding protein
MLTVSGLTVSIGSKQSPTDIVSDVSFAIESREILGLVGESGSGKSMTSLAAMGLLPKPGPRIRRGTVRLAGADVTQLEPWQRVRTGHGGMAMIFQEPMTSLNPVRRIGNQIVEAVRVRERISLASATQRARELLDLVRIPDAAQQLAAFPHQLSGGMRQRVMIAIALASRPQVLIADEPTTALDVTVQFQILGLLRDLCSRLDMAMLFITHDMGVIAQLADRVAVMYAGRIVETASVKELFDAPAHPYSRSLMACMPIRGARSRRLRTIAGQSPRPGSVKVGCAFAARCPDARASCSEVAPPHRELAVGHDALCAFPVTDGRPL